MLKKLFATTPEKNQLNEVSMTALRVYFGLTFALAHGLGKVMAPDQIIGGLEAMSFPAPELFGWLAALSEFGGGLLIALGFCTRLGATGVTVTMAVAVLVAHAQDPFGKKELALIYMLVAIVFLVRGAGKYSIDNYIKIKK